MDPDSKNNNKLHADSVGPLEQPSSSHGKSNMGVPTVRTRNKQHDLFCKLVGLPLNYDELETPSLWKGRRKEDKALKGLFPRVRAAYRFHTIEYWFLSTLSNGFLMLQIVLGAALTALGGTKTNKVDIVIVLLGAIQTVIGGFIAYFKSCNQPNRARQYRSSLQKVLESIENAEFMLRDPDYKPPPYTAVPSADLGGPPGEHWLSNPGTVITGVEGMVLRLMDRYIDVVREAEANNPGTILSSKGNNPADHAGMNDLIAQLRQNGAAQAANPSRQGSVATTLAPTATTGNSPQGGATKSQGSSSAQPTGHDAV